MNNNTQNHKPDKRTFGVKNIVQLIIIGIILFFIYIFVFYHEDIRQGFLEGWHSTE